MNLEVKQYFHNILLALSFLVLFSFDMYFRNILNIGKVYFWDYYENEFARKEIYIFTCWIFTVFLDIVYWNVKKMKLLRYPFRYVNHDFETLNFEVEPSEEIPFSEEDEIYLKLAEKGITKENRIDFDKELTKIMENRQKEREKRKKHFLEQIPTKIILYITHDMKSLIYDNIFSLSNYDDNNIIEEDIIDVIIKSRDVILDKTSAITNETKACFLEILDRITPILSTKKHRILKKDIYPIYL